MSISAKPWDSAGGGASSDTLNDVTGRGATTANSIQVGGLNIAGNYAMPSADGSVNQVLQTDGSGSLSFTTISVTGGLTYKGTYYLSSPADLSNAVQGDFYIIQGDGTLYGKAWVTGDHLVINADMGGSVSNSKIDKIDNTDIVTSVNALTGPVVLNGTNLDGDHTPSNYSTDAGSDKIEKHLEGIDNKFGTLGTASTKDTGVANGNVIVADATGLPVIDGSQLTGITATDATKLAIANNLSDLNNVGTARTNLGLGTASTSASSDFLAVSNNLSDLNNAGTARTNLGLGTASTKDTGVANGNVIVADATGLPVIDGSQLTGITATDATKLAIANNLSDLNNAGTARTNLGLVIGTNVQAYDPGLTSIASLTTAADKMIFTDGSDSYAVTGLTSAGRALLDDADASAQRTTLGLGTASTKDTGVANGNVIVADATGLPVIDGSQLTGITATDATKLAIANNLSDLNNVGTARTNLGLGTASTSASSDFLAVSNNLSDLNNAGTARTNLGLVIGTDVSAIASPAFTGSPTAPTQSQSDGSTKLATTAYVDTAVVAGGGLSSVVQDTSPELGGNLDVLARSIVSSSNRAITLTPDGSGLVTISGNATSGSGQIQLNCEQNSHGIKIKGPPHSATASYTLTLPDDVGSAGQFLKTDGSGGTLTWGTASATDATKLAILNNLSDLDNAGTARTNLGLVIGTNVQAYDPGLTSIAGLTTAADKMIFTDGSDSYAVTGLTSAGRALLDDADASAQRTTLGLAIGTNVQAYDLGLTSIASLTTAADKMLYTDGSDSYAVTGLTSAGRALLDDADASAQRTTLGLVIGTDVAPIAAPAFTGNATAVTQSQSDGSTKIATTAYVDTAVAGGGGGSAPTVTTVTQSTSPYPSSGVLSSTGIEQIFIIDADTTDVTVNLPAASTAGAGFKYQIKGVNSTYKLTLTPASGTIDGAATRDITVEDESVTLVSDNSNWFII